VPDAFLPFALLEAAGVEAVTPAGQLRRARRAMKAWRRCSAELVFSWPQQVDDAVLEPSPLLPPAVDDVATALAIPTRDGLLRLGAALEACGPDLALPWSSGERVRGGTRLLQAQSDCPFRASAEWRLKCVPIESPAAGIDARIHGQIVHGALERIWRQLGGSAELQRLGEAGTTALVSQAVSAALDAHRQRMLLPLPAPLWQVERHRCEQLVRALLVQECKREPFVVAQIEQPFVLNLGELSMRVRLDRLDRLTDDVDGAGRTVLIDYKTGKAKAMDWLAERPQQAQLLAYAMSAGAELCALSAVHLHRDGIRWAGIADQAGRLPKVPAAAELGVSWPQLRARWQQQLQQLGAGFVAGEASVDPQRDACGHCHLQLLCRIDAATAVELTSDEPAVDD
jgi:probable DNA repair protein